MTVTETMQPVRLAGSVLTRSCHVCAFFHSKEEQYRVLMPFFKDGVERGDRCFHILDPNYRDEHVRRLEREGIDVAGARAKGLLDIRTWMEAYVEGGRFDQERWLAKVLELLDPARRPPGTLVRGFANMEWAQEDFPGAQRLVEYETRLNYYLPKYTNTAPVVCTYDLTRFGAEVVMDILRTHPMVIIGGILQENPFYVPPDEMLKELEERTTQKAYAGAAS
jgi:hypothetical protein